MPVRRHIRHPSVLLALLAIAARLASPATADLSYALLAVYALLGRREAIQALALSWLFTMLSVGVGPDAPNATIGRYLVVFAAAGSVLLRGGLLRWQKLPLFTLLVGVFMLGHSVLFSPIPDVSILKAISWTLVTVTLLRAWSEMTGEETRRTVQSLYMGLVAVMVVSAPLAPLAIGYLRNGTGFQGILNHPQAFGPVMALLAAWTLGRVLAERRLPWVSIGIIAVSMGFVVMSETRTAGVAMVLGVGIAVIGAPWVAGRSIRAMAPGLMSRRFFMVGLLCVMGAVAAGSQFGGLVTDFISKSGRAQATGLLEAYDQSRGGLMDEMWANIDEHPLTGIGFGIASDPLALSVTRDPVLGLPVGAAVEKGVVPLAVLEELGLPGFVLVVAWAWSLIKRAARRGIAPLAVLSVALLLNMGEAVLFSPGGMGMLILVMVTWAAAAPRATAESLPKTAVSRTTPGPQHA